MASDGWTTIPFDQAVQVNPPVRLQRGATYPFLDMQTVDPGSRSVGQSDMREFKGSGSRFMNGDTLMTRITPCLENGKIAQFDASDDQPICHGSTEFIVIRGRPNVTDNDFAYYLTKWDGVRHYCISQMIGSSGRQRVPTNALSHYEVKIPPLSEQRAIACILGALDDKIELNRRMNETLEAMARAIFKSWFVDFDPVRAKADGRKPIGLAPHIADLFPDAFEDSELGQIPKGWKVGCINNVAKLQTKSALPAKEPKRQWEHYSIPAFDEGRYPVIERGSSIKSGKYFVPPTCVLVSKLNPQFPRVWLPSVQNEDVAVCSTEFLPIVPEETGWRAFLYELVNSTAIQLDIRARATGSTGSRQRVKPDDIASIRVVNPRKDLIELFGIVVEPLHAKTLKSVQESRTLADLRDALLPKLITGEIRVSDVEKIVERYL